MPGDRRFFATLGVALLAAALLVACGGGGDSPPPVLLAKSVQNIQCEPPRTTMAALDAELQAAGFATRPQRCAWDGLLYCAACGCGSSYLRLIEVPAHRVAAARQLGYVTPNSFPAAEPMSCPAR